MAAMAGVTEEKEEGEEEERKSEESNNSDNLVGFISLMRPTGRATGQAGGGVSRPRSRPCCWLPNETTLKIKTQRSKEARVEHRDPRLPSRYISRGSASWRWAVEFIQQLSCKKSSCIGLV